MIVRTWHGVVPIEKTEAFHEYLFSTGVAEAKATPGNLGVEIHSQPQDGFAHFFMVSYWIDFDAVKAFAGPNPDIAVCYPEDKKFNLISDPIVLHHELQNLPKDGYFKASP